MTTKPSRRLSQQLKNVCYAAAVASYAAPAAGASLKQVTSFGENPSNIKMYLYVPDKLASATPPVLVGVHWCHGDAPGFYTGTGFAGLADKFGFIVIYPSAVSSDGCWDVHSSATLTHDGGSDSRGIISMVSYVIQNQHGDPKRVYVTGHSSGGMMTNVLVGAYPDVFRAGAAFAGVPFSCFSGPDTWNTACATGSITKTGAQWGDAVRAAFPGYSGPRPRMQLFHGTEDDTLKFHNFDEEIKEWTNVLGASETPSSTETNTPHAPFTRTRYTDANKVVRVEAVEERGQPHNLEIMASEAVHFFGLDASADPVPLPGTSGASGAGGASAGTGSSGGGAAGSSPGAAGSGGGAAESGGSGGNEAQAGAPRNTGGSSGASVSGTAGSSAAGATPATGGSSAGARAGAPSTASSPDSDSSSCSLRGPSGAQGERGTAALGLLGLLFAKRRKRSR